MDNAVAENNEVKIESDAVHHSSTLFATPTKRKFVLSLLLVAITLLVYAPLRNYPFINYDDNLYVTQNIPVQTGLNWKSVQWAFTTIEASNYHPITWLSHELDVQLFGLNPAGHHLTSMVLHAINVVLLFLLLARATGSIWRSLTVAVVFAVHPLNIQSVAWVSERKNLLSTMFGLGTLWAYGWYAIRPNWRRYLGVFVLFILGLLSKPMLVTMPFALLLLDYWVLRRFPANFYRQPEAPELKRIAASSSMVWRLVAEKVPFLALVAVSCWVTYGAQRFQDSSRRLHVPLPYRIENAVYSYANYLYKMCWPAKLAIFYPHPRNFITGWQIGLASLLLVLLSVGAWSTRRRVYPIVGWLWYLGTLVPVIGLVQVGAQARADRYAYLPMWGVLVMVIWWLADLARSRNSRRLVVAIVVMAVAGLCWAARIQLGYWRDSATLFARSLEVSPSNNYISHANLGSALKDMGRYDEAAEHLTLVLRRFPDAALVRNDYATALLLQGKTKEAAEQYTLAIPYAEGSPHFQSAIEANLGMAQEQLGETEQATASYEGALQLNPLLYPAHVSLGLLFYRQGRLTDAISHLQASIGILPTALAYYSLGHILEDQNRLPEAAAAYNSALRLQPGMVEARGALEQLSERLSERKKLK